MDQQATRLNRRQVLRAAWAGFLAAIAAAGLARDARPGDQPKDEQESWYLFRIAGRDVGHIHEAIRREGDRVTTTVETLVVINRLGTKVEIKGTSVFTEAAEGPLRSAHAEMSSSRQTTTLDATVEKDAVRLVVSTGSKEYRRDLDGSGDLLGPWGIRRRTSAALVKVGDSVTGRTLVPEMQRATTMTRKLLERDCPLPALGTKETYLRVEERLEGFPSVRSVWLDGRGRMVRQTEPSPFGEMEVLLTDRASALRAGGESLPEEMFARTLVRSNIRLPGPRSMDWLVLRLRQESPGTGWPDFSGPGQTILKREGNELLLEVKRVQAEGTAPRPSKADGSLREFLEPNALVQSDDPEVRRIAHEVAGEKRDAFRAACRLRDWVHRNMDLDLGIALTPGSEVIRRRKGTCVAYAILLASLARAEGIPSRVVTGFVYVAGIWGGHAWVEVRAGDRWVALDGALPSTGAADAARFACVRSSMADGAGSMVNALGRIAGNVRVGVVEYEAGSVRTVVPADAPGFTIDGDVYRNPWLRLEVRKPAGFSFAETHAVYPDSTVVAIEGTDGRGVRLRQHAAPARADDDESTARVFRRLGFSGQPAPAMIAGRTVLMIEADDCAGLAFVDGPDLWVLTAEGRDAGALVRQAAEQVTIRPRGQ
jgi:transglutaminase-like putative cysteine protease